MRSYYIEIFCSQDRTIKISTDFFDINKKKYLLAAFGVVRDTINTPRAIDKLMNRPNAPTALSVRCVDHQEYSLFRILFLL